MQSHQHHYHRCNNKSGRRSTRYFVWLVLLFTRQNYYDGSNTNRVVGVARAQSQQQQNQRARSSKTAFFPDGQGIVGCKSNGYGMKIDTSSLQYSCGMRNQRLCRFGDRFTIKGGLSSTKKLPNPLKVAPKICHSSGTMCSGDLATQKMVRQNADGTRTTMTQNMIINLCNGPINARGNQTCPNAGNYNWTASVITPDNGNQYLASATTTMTMRVSFSPVKDFYYYTAIYKQQSENGTLTAEEEQALWKEYLSTPTEAVYCHLPFTMVHDTFDLAAYYRKIDGPEEEEEEDDDSFFDDDSLFNNNSSNRQYSYAAESLGLVAFLMSVVYGWRRRKLRQEQLNNQCGVDGGGTGGNYALEEENHHNKRSHRCYKQQEMIPVTNFVAFKAERPFSSTALL